MQRLLELVAAPRTHYRHLPKFLRAVERVVSVSSSTAAFPLADGAAAGFTNGLGSDESLGGALLTPIPWLAGDAEGRALSEEPEIDVLDVGLQPAGTVFGAQEQAPEPEAAGEGRAAAAESMGEAAVGEGAAGRAE